MIYPYVVVDVAFVDVVALVVVAAIAISSPLLLARVNNQRVKCSLGGRGEAVPEKLFITCGKFL